MKELIRLSNALLEDECSSSEFRDEVVRVISSMKDHELTSLADTIVSASLEYGMD